MNSKDQIVFFVQGSAAEPYKVVFRKTGDNMTALCGCPAGINAQYCKHRFNILSGCIDNVVNVTTEEAVEAVSIVCSWLPGTDVELAWRKVLSYENEMKDLKKRLSSAKKLLAKAMRD